MSTICPSPQNEMRVEDTVESQQMSTCTSLAMCFAELYLSVGIKIRISEIG